MAIIVVSFVEEGLPGDCVVETMDDCLLIPFFAIRSPRSYASEDFFSYKSRCGFSILTVCDRRRKAIHVCSVRVPAARLFAMMLASTMALSSQTNLTERFFAPGGQYVVADSAFPVGDHCSLYTSIQNAP